MTPRTVLFLGAGASTPFGFPVTAEILPEVLRRLASGTIFDAERNPAARQSTDELGLLLRRFLPGLFRHGAEAPLITDLLSLIDEMLRSENAPAPDVSVPDLSRLRVLMERAIAEVLAEPARPAPDRMAVIDGFVEWIHRTSDTRAAHLSVVSTNYDFALEKRILERVEPGDVPRRVDYGLTYRLADDADGGRAWQRPTDPWLSIFKLHGSLNWLRCPLCNHLYIHPGLPIFRAGHREARDESETCACGHGPLRHVIVTPSMIRDVRDANLLTVWQSALEALRTADEWVIVGYSLPPEDIAIRSMLLRAYRGRPRPPQVRVVQRQEGGEVEERYRLLFPDLEFRGGGVEGFVESLRA